MVALAVECSNESQSRSQSHSQSDAREFPGRTPAHCTTRSWSIGRPSYSTTTLPRAQVRWHSRLGSTRKGKWIDQRGEDGTNQRLPGDIVSVLPLALVAAGPPSSGPSDQEEPRNETKLKSRPCKTANADTGWAANARRVAATDGSLPTRTARRGVGRHQPHARDS